MATAKFTKQMTVAQFDRLFPTDDACKSYLVARRWLHGVRCPRCGNGNVSELTKKPFHWQCRQCSPLGYRFSVLVGTIFENTNIPMRTWFKVIYLMLTSKKGIAAIASASDVWFRFVLDRILYVPSYSRRARQA